jgi:hypothetical protein
VRRREVRSAEALLRLALAYGPGGLSLRAAAAWAGVGGLADMSDTTVMKRVRNAAAWLGEVAGALVRRAAAAPEGAPGALQDRRLRIADGSVVTRPGSRGPDWRLHAVYEPAAGRFSALELTDGRGAEGFGRAEFAPGDVAMGDRSYARPPALRRILDCGADFIVRTGWTRLRLLAEGGEPVDWEAILDLLAPGGTAERAVSVVHAGAGGKVLFAARRCRQCRQPCCGCRRRPRRGRPRHCTAARADAARGRRCSH